MNLILFMAIITLFISGTFVGFYFWAVSNDQFEDLETPAHRVLKKDDFNLDTRNQNE